jgi:two-component system chemotaxis response regulator CheY
MRAIVVDDSKAMRTILKRLLLDCGYDEIDEAENGEAALTVLRQGSRPDLMLVDWNMPVMNGLEFVTAVREIPIFHSTVIMMITTETAVEGIEQAIAAGADEYLMKPFNREALLEKLEILKESH